MDDDTPLPVPPLSNQIIEFLRAIDSPEQDEHFPLSDIAAGDIVHLPAELEQSDENNDYDHQHEVDQNHNHPNRDDVNSENGEFRRRHRRHALRLHLRDAGLSAGRHDRILDWAELLLQLEDQSVTFGLQRLEFEDSYVGNPDDYVDETAYDSLLQTLADDDDGNEQRGSPPASKSVAEALPTVEVNASNTELCTICNDGVYNAEEKKIVKQLPCGHLFHDVCITPWLNLRNTCPVCRHELPTDDPEYEEGRMQRSMSMATTTDHDSGV